MATTSITERMAGDGLQQHLHAEPATVAECKTLGTSCWVDTDCCGGLICEWWTCRRAG
ncbi:MAG TPA: Dickkopf N-terminal cysteine-rich domain-containing protein [Spirillospora sp.]